LNPVAISDRKARIISLCLALHTYTVVFTTYR